MALLDYASIRYQAEEKLIDLAVEVSEASSIKKVKAKLDQAVKIRYLLKAIEASSTYITSKGLASIYQCLQYTAEVTDFPVAPELGVTSTPTILLGIPGADGADGADGAQGPAGPTGPAGSGSVTVTLTGQTLTQFTVDALENLASPYDIAVRWDVYATRTDTAGVAIFGTVIGAMTNSGGINSFSDVSTIGSTTAYFDVFENNPEISLRFNRAAGAETWLVHVKRYIITDFTLA